MVIIYCIILVRGRVKQISLYSNRCNKMKICSSSVNTCKLKITCKNRRSSNTYYKYIVPCINTTPLIHNGGSVSKSLSTRILKLGRTMWVISFILRLLYVRRSCQYTLDSGLAGLQSRSECGKDDKLSCQPNPVHPAHSKSLYSQGISTAVCYAR
jgi:hypothetical protein